MKSNVAVLLVVGTTTMNGHFRYIALGLARRMQLGGKIDAPIWLTQVLQFSWEYAKRSLNSRVQMSAMNCLKCRGDTVHESSTTAEAVVGTVVLGLKRFGEIARGVYEKNHRDVIYQEAQQFGLVDGKTRYPINC